MAAFDPRELDEAIDAALRSGPMRAVPFGFGRKVRARVAVMALMTRERQALCYSIAASGLVSLGLAGTGLFLFLFPEWFGLFVRNVPGGMGFCDFLLASTNLDAPRILGLLALLAGLPFSAAALAVLRRDSGPWRGNPGV